MCEKAFEFVLGPTIKSTKIITNTRDLKIPTKQKKSGPTSAPTF